MGTTTASLARRMWWVLEPYHAVVYFAPEVASAWRSARLKGFWMGYFASRAAPLGPTSAAIVEACFYNFHPGRVRRAIPDAWSLTTPETVLLARLHGVDQALWRLLGDEVRSVELARVAEIARAAAESADCGGRVLAAAHRELDWPTVPHLQLWHAATILREHRGDGHVAALVGEAVDGCEAHVLAVTAKNSTEAVQRDSRGWSDVEWNAAVERLQTRGWINSTGGFTKKGRGAYRAIEHRTDRAAEAPYAGLVEADAERLGKAMMRLSRAVVVGNGVPFPNPMAMPNRVCEEPPT